MASAPVVGAWCSCKNGAMELIYKNRWEAARTGPTPSLSYSRIQNP
jgi:hypothetical protein